MIVRFPVQPNCLRASSLWSGPSSGEHCYGFTRRRRPKIRHQAVAAGREDAVLLREELAAGPAKRDTHHPSCKHSSRPNRSRPVVPRAVQSFLVGRRRPPEHGAGPPSARVRARPPDVNVNASVAAAAPRRPDHVVALKRDGRESQMNTSVSTRATRMTAGRGDVERSCPSFPTKKQATPTHACGLELFGQVTSW